MLCLRGFELYSRWVPLFNSDRIEWVHQHGGRFIALEHQYGRRDVMCKRSIGRHWLISETQSVSFAMKAIRCALPFPPYKAVAPGSPFFSNVGSETSSQKRHILMRIRHRLLLHLFSVEGDETPSKKRHILISAVLFSTNSLKMHYFTKTEPAIVS